MCITVWPLYLELQGRRKRTLHLYAVTATNLGLLRANAETSHSVRIGPGGGWLRALWAVVKIFQMVRSRKPPLLALYNSATTLLPTQGTYTIQHGCAVFSNIPRPPVESIDDLSHQRTSKCERANIRPLLTPRAIARGACGH